jgi:integrase
MVVDRRVSAATGKVTWRVRVLRGSKTIESATFETQREAKEFDAARKTQVRRGDWIDPARGKVHVAAIAADYLASRSNVAPLTKDTDQGMWDRHLAPTFATRSVGEITQADVSAWLGKMADKGAAPSTRRRALATLRGVLGYAVADERIRLNPAAAVKAPKGGARREGQALTPQQLARLIGEIPESCRPAVFALATTGMRVSELCGLRVGDVYDYLGQGLGFRLSRSISQTPASGAAVVGDLKSHRARTVPVPPTLVAWVRARMTTASADEPLFSSPTGKPWTRGNLAVRADWSRARLKAGLPTLRIHDLRHTALSSMIASGADVLAVSRVAGHSTPTLTLSLYGHHQDEALWKAVAKSSADLELPTDQELTKPPRSRTTQSRKKAL